MTGKSTHDTLETKVAVFDGFYGGGRIRAGETFVAPKKETSKWFRSADEADVTADLGGEPTLLDKPARDIVAALGGLSDQELNGLISAEQAGKTRKAVIAAIQDEIDNRVGRVTDKEPKAKKPDEKEPKTEAEPGVGDDLLK